MKNLSKRYVGRYPNSGLARIVGDEFYQEWVEDYTKSLYQFFFKGAWAARANLFRKGLLRFIGRNELTELFLERSYYCSPLTQNRFCEMTNQYLTTFFHNAALRHGKKRIVEHTPTNLIHADFIQKIFPSMKLIHIYRDPRDVISSYTTKDWGTTDLRQNLRWISDILDRWEEVKEKIPREVYYELSFEQLIDDFESQLRSLCDFLTISFDRSMLDINISRHNIGRWKNKLSDQDMEYIIKNYQYLLEIYGYE